MQQQYLIGPKTDFLCLGGAAFFILPVFMVLSPYINEAAFLSATLWLTNLINHPHFAHSYQIFYAKFRDKTSDPQTSRELRLRYMFAGYIVPLLLVAYMLGCFWLGSLEMMGKTAFAMSFFVGWHYVKQGYGMLMLDAVLKKRFFNEHEKKILLINAYIVWAASWIALNASLAERSLWGIEYAFFDIPLYIRDFMYGLTALSTVAVLVIMSRRILIAGKPLPFNGTVAYAVSLYLWLLIIEINIIWAILVPALHSLQYLIVVWRFQANRSSALLESEPKGGLSGISKAANTTSAHVARFVGFGILLGAFGFWLLPAIFIQSTDLSGSAFEPAVFFFMFWIFFNVHHYFIDNVIWRKENTDTSRYLFAHTH